jgi:hypothetical protein
MTKKRPVAVIRPYADEQEVSHRFAVGSFVSANGLSFGNWRAALDSLTPLR